MKYRHECKYVVSDAEIMLLMKRIDSFMKLDPNVGKTGSYNIRSLYFDDYYNRCFYENENGTDVREKFRIRIYNHSRENIKLECKGKIHGMTSKKAVSLSIEDTKKLMYGQTLDFISERTSLERKLMLQMMTRGVKPVIIVEYDRIPYIYDNGNVRVTFDKNISFSLNKECFLEESINHRPIMLKGQHLMEVKFDEYLPDYIYNALNLGTLQQTAFSKYYLSRKYAQIK